MYTVRRSMRFGMDVDDTQSSVTELLPMVSLDENMSKLRVSTFPDESDDDGQQKSQTYLTIIPAHCLPKPPAFEPFQDLGAKRINEDDHDSLCDAIKDDKDVSKYHEIFDEAGWVDLQTLDLYLRQSPSADKLRERLNTKFKTNWDLTDVKTIVNFIKKSTCPDVKDIILELESDVRYANLILNYVNFRKYVIPDSHPLSQMGTRQRDTEIPTLDDDRPYLPLLGLPRKSNVKSKVIEYIRERAVTIANSEVNNYNCFVLYGVSGCGKTSSIFRYLALNYGIYFEASLSIEMGNKLSPDMVCFTDMVEEITGDDIEKRTEHLIKCLLLGRILLLRFVYLKKVVDMLSKEYDVKPPRLKHAWLHFQLRLNEVRTNCGNQLIVVLFKKLCECDESAVEAALKESVNFIATMGKKKIAVPVFIDEAQVLTNACAGKFEDSKKNPRTRALFSKVFRVMNSLPSPSKNTNIATFVSGTAITLTHEINLIRSAVGKPEAELPDYLIFKDFERMLERQRMEAYVRKFINFTKLGSRSIKRQGTDIVEEVYTTFKGRPRFLAYFIATCLRSKETDGKCLLLNSVRKAKATLIGVKGERDNKISIRCALEKSLPHDYNESRRPAEIRSRGGRMISIIEMLKKLVLSYMIFGAGEESFTHYWEDNSDAADLIDDGICYLKFDDEMKCNKPERYGVQEPLVVEAIEGFIRDEYQPKFSLSNEILELAIISSPYTGSSKGLLLEQLAPKWLQNFFSDEELIKAQSKAYEHLKDYRFQHCFGGVDAQNGVVTFAGRKVCSVEMPKRSNYYDLWQKNCRKSQKAQDEKNSGYPCLHRFLLEPFADFLLPEQDAGPDIVFLLDRSTKLETGEKRKFGNEARDSSRDDQKLCLVQCKWTGQGHISNSKCLHGYETTLWKNLYRNSGKKPESEFSTKIVEDKYKANEIGTVSVLICLPDFAPEFRKQHPEDIEVNGKDISFFINFNNMVQFGAPVKVKEKLKHFFTW